MDLWNNGVGKEYGTKNGYWEQHVGYVGTMRTSLINNWQNIWDVLMFKFFLKT